MSKVAIELDAFIESWKETPQNNRQIFVRLKDLLSQQPGVVFDFIPRPGVTYSLRVSHPALMERPLFAMVDVIEDQPRWLSVCFYGEMVTDPDEKGDFVPEGLLGEDAVCFDIESFQEDDVKYVEDRLMEAYRCATKS